MSNSNPSLYLLILPLLLVRFYFYAKSLSFLRNFRYPFVDLCYGIENWNFPTCYVLVMLEMFAIFDKLKFVCLKGLVLSIRD